MPATPTTEALRRRVVRTVAWIAVAAGAGLLAWTAWQRTGGREEPPRPVPRRERPVVLVTLDTTRADHLGAYGAGNGAESRASASPTPSLDRLAEAGVLFENAYSVAPITLVAHTSILTGLDPPRHGVRNNGLHSVPDRVQTLAERLREAGYATGAFVSAAVLDRRYNLTQGFDVYDDDLSTGRERHPRMVADRPASAAVDSATAWLDTLPPDAPYFLWLHLYDPHAPYSPPPPWRDEYREDRYTGEIAFMDDQIGRLLRHERVASEALISVIGDHGESLGEHGEQTHALLAYDSTLHVPWILRVPGGPRALRLAQTVGQVDLVPTVLDLLGHDPPEDGSGTSLVPLLEGRLAAGDRRELDRALYAETFLPYYTYGWSKLRVLRQGRMKWIDAPTPELYDTVRDPRELSNLAEQEPGVAHDMERSLRERLERLGAEDGTGGENELALDGEARERLRGLGYLAVGSSRDENGEDSARPDPKELIDLHVGLERARSLIRDRLFPEAERQLRTVLRRDPKNLAAMIDLATVLGETGKVDEAVAVLERALDLDPDYPRLYLQLAGIEAQRGDPAKALELVEAALALDPRLLEGRMRKAVLLQRTGRPAAAEKTLDAALADEPEEPSLNVLYARMIELPRAPAAAEDRVRAALEHDPFLVSGWQLLGEILQATGRPEEALEAWRSGLERQPDHAELHAHLGTALARRSAGNTAGNREAEVHLREALRLSTEPRLDLRVTLGAWLADRGRFEAAQGEYARVLEEAPNHPGARNNRAVAFYRSGRRAEAEREWLELVERHPRHADAHNNLAALALEAERYEEAARRARRALELAPRMAEAWNNLGLARAGLGELGEARRCYERALEIAPDDWQAKLNLGRLLRRQDEPHRAAEVLEELVTAMPGLAEASLELGRLYAGPLDRPERARSHFNAFLRRAPDDPRADAVREQLRELPGGS